MRVDMCVDMCIDVCIDMSRDLPAHSSNRTAPRLNTSKLGAASTLCIAMCIDVCMDMCVGVCTYMYSDVHRHLWACRYWTPCLDVCIHAFRHAYKHVYRHVYRHVNRHVYGLVYWQVHRHVYAHNYIDMCIRLGAAKHLGVPRHVAAHQLGRRIGSRGAETDRLAGLCRAIKIAEQPCRTDSHDVPWRHIAVAEPSLWVRTCV